MGTWTSITITILLTHIKAQWQTFYNFDCDTLNTSPASTWTGSGIINNPPFVYCPSTIYAPCWDLLGLTSAFKTIPTTGYHSIRVYLDAGQLLYDPPIGYYYCHVLFRGSSSTSWYTGMTMDSLAAPVLAVQINIPDTSEFNDQSTFQLQLVNTGPNAENHCYFDRIQVMGIPITTSPTPSPTNIPTPSPTNNPTPSPTNTPTEPTRIPTSSIPITSIPSTSISTIFKHITIFPTSLSITKSPTQRPSTPSPLLLIGELTTKNDHEGEIMSTNEKDIIVDEPPLFQEETFLIITIITVVISVISVCCVVFVVYRWCINKKLKTAAIVIDRNETKNTDGMTNNDEEMHATVVMKEVIEDINDNVDELFGSNDNFNWATPISQDNNGCNIYSENVMRGESDDDAEELFGDANVSTMNALTSNTQDINNQFITSTSNDTTNNAAECDV